MRAILFFSLILFFSSILLAPVLSASAAETGDRHEVTVLSWTPIKNLSDPQVQFIARFAVEENGNPQLNLNRVVFGATLDTQNSTISITYGLVIETTILGGSLLYYYETVVKEIPKHSLELISINPIWETLENSRNKKETYHNLFISSILLAPTLSASAALTGDQHEVIILGGYTPIKNLSDPHVQEIARFAVVEYNKKGGRPLKLESVLIGAKKVGEGTYYGLVIEATDGGVPFQYYKVVVFEIFLLPYPLRELTTFEFLWE